MSLRSCWLIRVKRYLAVAALFSLPAFSEVTYDDFRQLTPLPDDYYELSTEEREKWLKQALKNSPSPAKTYQLKRSLFANYYYQGDLDKSAKWCEDNRPLREDLYYRQMCIEVLYPKFDDYLPKVLEIIHDAKQNNDMRAAAEFLMTLAWRQSQHGNIAAAFQSYETALSLAPSDDLEFVSRIMMDTATNYIVHGDRNYIEKGIELLKRIREQSQDAIENSSDPQEVAFLEDTIQLTNFNSGIAYALHLYDFEKALAYFDRVNQHNDSSYVLSSLSFSAIAAAELGQYDRARAYLEQVDGRSESYPVIDAYLSCYRQLTRRHWNAEQSLSKCLNLDPETTVEVQLDVYKRLSDINDPEVQLVGLRKLKHLFETKLEPQLRGRGSQAASNTELKRLQRESELKSVVLEQQEELQKEREATHANRIKFFIASFIVLISLILLVASQLRQKKKLAEQFQRMSVRDSLTKLGNRRYLEQNIERELAFINRAFKSNQDMALGIYIFDIDHFKRINDTYGHQVGDEVLQEVSRRIQQVTRDTDLLVRWGGEEFVFVARLDNNQRTYQLADRILTTISSVPFMVTNHEPLEVTCTIGVVKYPFIDTDNLTLWTRLISLADAALYLGKKRRNCWVAVQNENLTELEQVESLLTVSLEDAVEQNRVSVKTSYD